MQILTAGEIVSVNGGFISFIVGSAIGLIAYAINKHSHEEPMTIPGAATAAGFGAVTGGIGSMAVGAAGGGIIGNIVWRPGFAAINAAGQAIAAEQQ